MAQIFKRRKYIFPHREAKKFKNYKWTFNAMIRALKTRLEIEKDALILVSGDTGSGKSHLIGNFCLKFFSKEPNFINKSGKMFEKDNFIIDAGELAVKMITKSGSVLWADEGRRAVNRRQWFDKINKTILNRKNTGRKMFNIIFILMPYEKEFDPSLAPHLTLWLWVRRGVVEVYCKSSSKKGGQGLNIENILEREEKWLKENPKATFVLPTIHPEFIGRIFFNKLTEGYRKQYDSLVEEKKAVGELSEEEKEKYGIIEQRSPESLINEAIDNIKKGNLDNKRELWNDLKEKTKLPDDKLLKQLNFYLKLEGFSTFNKLFSEKKKNKMEDLFA